VRLRITAPFISLGFVIVLLLMAGMMTMALRVMDASVARTETIVQQYNAKSRLVGRMHTAARERILALNKMLILDDPFERDAEWMAFNAAGTAFVTAREELTRMDLTDEERDLLASQARITRTLGPLQNEIAERVLSGDSEQARRMLLERAIPLQNQAFGYFLRFDDRQQALADSALADARREQAEARDTLVLGAFAVGTLCVLIAVFVVRRTADTELRLRRERRQALVTLHAIADGVVTTDATGRIEQVNDVAATLLGVTPGAARGAPIEDHFRVVRESDHAPLPNPVRTTLERCQVQIPEQETLLAGAGTSFAIEYTASPIRGENGELLGAILVFRDVTEMRALARQLSYHASHDPLTGLYNRREFEQHLDQALGEVRDDPTREHWLCYLDLDQFKVINDTCGHVAGDELLKQIAALLRHQMRDRDVIARMGGDEFAVLLPDCPREQALRVAERLRHGLESLRFSWQDKAFVTSASIGLVAVTATAGRRLDLLSAADTACFVSKEEGRNRIHVYEPADDATVRRESEMEMVHRITRALDEDRFELFAQRIVNLQQGDGCLNLEILIRMRDEGGELLPPMAFIPAAERYNLMSRLDRWVIERALALLATCDFGSRAALCKFSINLSAQSLGDDDFHAFLFDALAGWSLSPAILCFEITETAAIANLSRARAFMAELKERFGCRFSLDDFGSGLSSFGYLKNMPVDYLKIDGGFIKDILDDPMDRAFVESINQIGHVIGVETIAEFVDDADKMALLHRMGVDYAQGYHVHRPQLMRELLVQKGLVTLGDSLPLRAAKG